MRVASGADECKGAPDSVLEEGCGQGRTAAHSALSAWVAVVRSRPKLRPAVERPATQLEAWNLSKERNTSQAPHLTQPD